MLCILHVTCSKTRIKMVTVAILITSNRIHDTCIISCFQSSNFHCAEARNDLVVKVYENSARRYSGGNQGGRFYGNTKMLGSDTHKHAECAANQHLVT